MTDPPKWWKANGPPSPTTPMKQLEMQVLQDKSTCQHIKSNPYYDLDDENENFLYKHQLYDGTFIFTSHPSIKEIHQVLKTTVKNKHKNSGSTSNYSASGKTCMFARPLIPKLKPDHTNAKDFTLVTKKSPKRKPLQQVNKNVTLPHDPNNIHKLTILNSSVFSLPTSKSRKPSAMSAVKRYSHKPRLVPKTPSQLPVYRDFFPATKALKEFFDNNPIDDMDLETARKTYDRCVKHSLGGFVPGHHPDQMSLQALRTELYRKRKDIEAELPKDLAQSNRIKAELMAITEARKHLPTKLSLHKDFPLQHLVGLTTDQLKAMIHNHYVKDRRVPPTFKKSDKDSLLCDFRYEVFLLKEAANELNKPACDPNHDTPIEYEYTEHELHNCARHLPQRLVINPRFPIQSLPALQRNQMEIMLQNHYNGNNVEAPDFDFMNDNTLRSRIHLAINGHLPQAITVPAETSAVNISRPPPKSIDVDANTTPNHTSLSSPTKRQRNNPKIVDVDMTNVDDVPESIETAQPMTITQSQPDNASENVDSHNESATSDTTTPSNIQLENSPGIEFESGDKIIANHAKCVEAIKNLTDDTISQMTYDDTITTLSHFATYQCTKFIGDNYRTTPIYLLKRYVQTARSILSGHSNGKILDDDDTLNRMATLDEDTIYDLENDWIDEFLSTCSRQYNIVVDPQYYASTAIEQKRIQLMKSLDEYKAKFLKTEPIIHLNENTTDHMIASASLNMIKNMLNEYIEGSEVHLENITFDNLNHVQLAEESKKLRNHLRIQKNLPPLPTNSDNQKGPSALQKCVANRNGNLFSKFLPKCTTYKSNSTLTNNKEGLLAHRFDQNDFYVRVSVPAKGNDVHIPTIIKLVFGKLRQADPSFTLMPFDRKNKTKNITIAKEDAIPKNKEDLNDWIQGIYITKRNRLLFSMRCTNNVPFKNVRAVLKRWQKDTDIKINFDAVLSQSLFPAGWLKMAHPRLLNRDSLFQWIIAKSDTDMIHKLHLYPRIMFEYRDDGSKALTEVLVLDGAFDSKKKILDFLLNIQWEGYYSDISFTPFRVDTQFTKEYQITSIDEHNEFCSGLSSEILTIKRPDTVITTDGSNSYRFIDWLATQNTNGLSTFYEVEQIGVTKVLIAYFDRHIATVNNFLQNMYIKFQQEYGDAVTNTVFGTNKFLLNRSEPLQSASIFKNLSNLNKANPQSTEEVIFKAPRAHGYYGQEPVTTSQNDFDAFGSKTFSAVTQTNNNVDNSDEVAQLSQLVYDLQTQVDSLKSTLTSEITGIVTKDVDTKIDTIQSTINERIDEVERNCDHKIAAFANKIDTLNSTVNSNHNILLAAIQGKPLPLPVTPSGVDDSARGGEK